MKSKSSKTPVILTIKMFYDRTDKDNGDGFYPILINSYGKNTANISFQLLHFCGKLSWLQVSDSVIYELEGNTGIDLLNYLNLQANVNAEQILNCGGRIIHPKINSESTFRILNAKA